MTRNGWIAFGGVSALAVVLAIALAVSLGDDDEDAGGPQGFEVGGAPGFAAPDPAQMQEFQDCLAEEGVETPGPGSLPRSGPPEGLEEALEACGDLLPEGAGPPGTPELRFGPPG